MIYRLRLAASKQVNNIIDDDDGDDDDDMIQKFGLGPL